MSRVFIIHGWGGRPDGKDWLPWAKEQLESRGYEVIMPLMPDADYPKIETWVPFLSEQVGTPQTTDCFIGHSIGCQTILRYLETLESGQKINKVILVAPWGVSLSDKAYEDEEDKETAKPWLKTPINWEKVRNSVDQFIAIFSTNDPFVPLEESKKFIEENLGAKIIIEENKGHFDEESGTTELPELLKFF